MTTNTGMALVVLGMLMTLMGVGGIENSVTDSALLSSVLVSVVGLAVMWAGTLGVRNGEYYD